MIRATFILLFSLPLFGQLYESGGPSAGLATTDTITENVFWKVAEYDGQVPGQRVLVTTPNTFNPTSSVIGTTPWRFAVLNFSASAINYAIVAIKIHPNWQASPVTFTVHWLQTAGVAAGNALWRVNTACVADGEDIVTEPAWNANQDAAIAEPTLNLLKVSSWTLTMTGCAGGKILFVRVGRIGDDVPLDTSLHSSNVFAFGMTYKRTLQ